MILPVTYKDKKGFTLIELLIIIALTLIVTGISVPLYGNLQQSAQMNDIESMIIQNIRIAQNRAKSGFNDSGHGVYININPLDTSSIILYQGSSYDTRISSLDREYEIHNAININTNIIDQDINFEKVTGNVSNFGDITIGYEGGKDRVINVNSLGYVE
jgi:type II secretory pathway pseudopilin PulG